MGRITPFVPSVVTPSVPLTELSPDAIARRQAAIAVPIIAALLIRAQQWQDDARPQRLDGALQEWAEVARHVVLADARTADRTVALQYAEEVVGAMLGRAL